MGISTHVLDTAQGFPAAGIAVRLTERREGNWIEVAQGRTDADGRIGDLLSSDDLHAAHYRLTFDLADYLGETGFFPSATLHFHVLDAAQHYHVPLLLQPFGYTTYRGS